MIDKSMPMQIDFHGSIDLEALVRRLVSNLGLITVRSGMVIGFTVFKRPKIHPAVLLFWV